MWLLLVLLSDCQLAFLAGSGGPASPERKRGKRVAQPIRLGNGAPNRDTATKPIRGVVSGGSSYRNFRT